MGPIDGCCEDKRSGRGEAEETFITKKVTGFGQKKGTSGLVPPHLPVGLFFRPEGSSCNTVTTPKGPDHPKEVMVQAARNQFEADAYCKNRKGMPLALPWPRPYPNPDCSEALANRFGVRHLSQPLLLPTASFTSRWRSPGHLPPNAAGNLEQ